MIELYIDSRRIRMNEALATGILRLLKRTEEGFKVCARCETRLHRRAFNKNTTRPDGLQTYCRDCKKIYKTPKYGRDRAAAQRAMARRVSDIGAPQRMEIGTPYTFAELQAFEAERLASEKARGENE